MDGMPAENSWEGATYVAFGGPRSARGPRRRAPLDPHRGLTEGSFAGTGVGCADVNGDGIDDVLIGAWAYEYAGRPAGTAARGGAPTSCPAARASLGTTIDLGTLGARGFGSSARQGRVRPPRLRGHRRRRRQRRRREDIAVMANTADTTDVTPARSTTASSLWSRASRRHAVDVSKPVSCSPIDGASRVVRGPVRSDDRSRRAGDVNGDDVRRHRRSAPTQRRPSAALPRRARRSPSAARTAAGSTSRRRRSLFAVGGAFAGHRLGIAIAGAGDVNDDGLDDLVSAPTAPRRPTATRPTSSTAPRRRAARSAARHRGARRRRLPDPRRPRRSTGYGIARSGDVNGDGLDDVAVGGYGARRRAGAGAGLGWIVRGVAIPRRSGARHGARPGQPQPTHAHARARRLGPSAARGSRARPRGALRPRGRRGRRRRRQRRRRRRVRLGLRVAPRPRPGGRGRGRAAAGVRPSAPASPTPRRPIRRAPRRRRRRPRSRRPEPDTATAGAAVAPLRSGTAAAASRSSVLRAGVRGCCRGRSRCALRAGEVRGTLSASEARRKAVQFMLQRGAAHLRVLRGTAC